MKKKILGLLAVGLLAGPMAANAVVMLGGFGGSRVLGGYSIFDPSAGRSELENAANHALYGDSIAFGPSTTLASDAYLAGVDIFFTGLLNFNAQKLSPAEVASLVSFINDGGVVIAHGDNTAFSETVDDLLNVFGLDVNNAANNGSDSVDVTDGAHPVMNGPFGAVSSHVITDSAYLAPDAGPGGGQVIAHYASGPGAIGVVGPGGGRLGGLLFLPDSESYGLTMQNFRNLDEARRVFNNGMAWAVGIAGSTPDPVPEPGSLALLGLGLAGLGLSRRRKAA